MPWKLLWDQESNNKLHQIKTLLDPNPYPLLCKPRTNYMVTYKNSATQTYTRKHTHVRILQHIFNIHKISPPRISILSRKIFPSLPNESRRYFIKKKLQFINVSISLKEIIVRPNLNISQIYYYYYYQFTFVMHDYIMVYETLIFPANYNFTVETVIII